ARPGTSDVMGGGDLGTEGGVYARRMTGKRLVRGLPVPASPPEEITAAVDTETRKARGREAVGAAIAAVQSAAVLPFAEALAAERSAFLRLKTGEEATALRHL